MGKDASEIRREIEETRARMGDTVEALSYKADVPARAKDAVHDRVESVKGTIGDVMSNVKDAVGGVKQRASESWSQTADRVPNAARRGVGRRFSRGTRDAGDGLRAREAWPDS
jgi:hypothetical protein